MTILDASLTSRSSDGEARLAVSCHAAAPTGLEAWRAIETPRTLGALDTFIDRLLGGLCWGGGAKERR